MDHRKESGKIVLSPSVTRRMSALEKAKVFENFAVYWHEECSLHKIKDHPEQPDRVSAILVALRKIYSDDCFRKGTLVTGEQILLFHTANHLQNLIALCDLAEKAYDENDDEEMHQSIDGDTVVMWKTRRAVWRAAGSVVSAIDDLYLQPGNSRRISYSFCCVRPPGHHAEMNKPGGFCFLNNAGIAAKYAQHKYGVQKVAVLDFDVHHGNGVEDGFKGDSTLFYGSTHEKDNYPGTGVDPSPNVGQKALDPLHRRIVNRTLNKGPQSITDFRRKWAEVVEEMVLFGPDLLIFSAGFDAHDEDPLANCELLEDDFVWCTQIAMMACLRVNPTNPAPILSVLEGGYDLSALASSAVAHCAVLSAGYSALSKSNTEALVKEGPQPHTPTDTTASLSGEDGDCEKSYGGDEAAALAAHIARLDLGPSTPRP